MNIKHDLAAVLAEFVGLDIEKAEALLEVPPRIDMGDLAFPCFQLAKIRRKAPQAIAQDLADEAKEVTWPTWIAGIHAEGPYLNFSLDRPAFIRKAAQEILEAGDHYGAGEEGRTDGKKKTVLIEFSSPNIAKPFHVGHAFSTVIGHALYRIHDFLGYDARRLNHLGDYGTQFGKLIVAYRRWVDQEALEADPIAELTRIYVRFHREAELEPELEEQARAAFKALEQGGEEELALWKRFRDLSLESFNEVYTRLGIAFDDLNGESFYSPLIPKVVEELREKNLLQESQGAQIVDLEEKNLPPAMILKSDGTTIYASRDITAVLYRIAHYDFDKNIYVVGNTQSLHFKQVFGVVEKMGYEQAKDCVHVAFGLVKFPDGKMSTRDGEVIYLRDLLDESVAKTEAIIRRNNEGRADPMDEETIKKTAETVGLGAVVHTFVKQSRERDIMFSWEEMLDFEGDTAPYLQYTYARARSILRRSGETAAAAQAADESPLESDNEAVEAEFVLTKALADFPAAIVHARQTYEPSMITRQLGVIARAFNSFYHRVPILKAAAESRELRLDLCRAACQVLKNGLYLLGIETVERM